MDSVFFWVSKLGWLFVNPGSILLGLTLLVWWSLRKGAFRLAKWLCGVLVALMLLIGFFPVGDWLYWPLERTFEVSPNLPKQVDGIIVLGGSINPVGSKDWQQPQLYESAEREFAFLALARRFPEAKLVFTGGSGKLSHQSLKESDYARALFSEQGLNPDRVVFEPNSRNTHENAVLSKAEVNPQKGEYWVLITSASHMKRSVGVFCQQQWPVMPYPVDFRSSRTLSIMPNLNLSGHLFTLHWAMREWIGIWVYQWTGKSKQITQACFPSETDALKRLP